MEKKQDDARNTETEKKPEAAGQHAQPGSARPDQVTDVELTNEQATPEKTTAHTDKADPAAAGKAVSGAAGGSVPPVNTGKDERNAGKGTKGPLIAAVVVVAAIAAGGYYYAQNNQSESESSSQTVSEPAGSSTSDTSTSATSASEAAKPDEAAAPDTTSSTSDTSDNAASAPNGDATSTSASGGEADSAAAGADESTSAAAGASATDEAETSNSSASADSAAANSDSAQTESDTKADAATQSGASVTDDNASAGESTDTTATTEKTDTTSASESAAATTESSPAPAETASAASSAVAADTGNTAGNAATGTAGFGGSIPADIRDQLDRQSAQIIALRDQLESSQKQLQQLQTTRLQAARDETTMFVVNDVSRLVTMAQNELAIAGNLENAVMSLETGIKAIDQADAPVLAGLRGALAADIVTLKSAPAIGVDAQFAEVAALSGKIDTLPMLAPDQAGAKPMAGQSTQVGATANEVNETNPAASSGAWYERAWNEVKTWPGAAWNGLRSDLGGIVRVEKLADPNQVLLSVDQAAQLRANLQQYLHFAQQALLNGQQGIWTSSLETVVKGIKQSFNQDSVETQHVLTQLQQLLKAGVKPELPPITQSVKAVEETRKQLKSMNPGQE